MTGELIPFPGCPAPPRNATKVFAFELPDPGQGSESRCLALMVSGIAEAWLSSSGEQAERDPSCCMAQLVTAVLHYVDSKAEEWAGDQYSNGAEVLSWAETFYRDDLANDRFHAGK